MKLPWLSLLIQGLPLASAAPTYQNKTSFNWDKTDFFLVFGDSYTYVQGTYGYPNSSFIGDLLNFNYTPSQLLSDVIVQNQTSTSAGGPNWVEYLTGCFSGLPSNCKKQLWDFAFGGADVSTEYTPLHHNYTVPLVSQISQWAQYALPYLPHTPTTSLVALFIGINDISDTKSYTFPYLNTTSFPSLYTSIISQEITSLTTLYDAGYRNYLFLSLPPLDRTPSNVLPGATPLPDRTIIDSWNGILASQISLFTSTYPDTKAMLFPTYKVLSSVLDNPERYGIKNTTGYCEAYDQPDISWNYESYGCLPLSEYFWYNTGHITWRVHEILAGEVERFLRANSW